MPIVLFLEGISLPRLFPNPFVYSEDLMPKRSKHKGTLRDDSAHTGKSVLRRMSKKMPTSLWLFHKGPLTLGCLFIILPRPQTHLYGSLLSKAVHVCALPFSLCSEGSASMERKCLRRESAVGTLGGCHHTTAFSHSLKG